MRSPLQRQIDTLKQLLADMFTLAEHFGDHGVNIAEDTMQMGEVEVVRHCHLRDAARGI